MRTKAAEVFDREDDGLFDATIGDDLRSVCIGATDNLAEARELAFKAAAMLTIGLGVLIHLLRIIFGDDFAMQYVVTPTTDKIALSEIRYWFTYVAETYPDDTRRQWLVTAVSLAQGERADLRREPPLTNAELDALNAPSPLASEGDERLPW